MSEIQKMTGAIRVKLPQYEGPLDLLLDLIQKNEMDIYDIKIQEITSQYLSYLDRMKELDLEIAGEFLVMAATLLYIKSRMLLPTDGTDLEEDETAGDPRGLLVAKLLEYKAFREAADQLGIFAEERAKLFTREIANAYLDEISEGVPEVPETESGEEEFRFGLTDLVQAFYRVIKSITPATFYEVYDEGVSLEEKIAEVKDRLSREKEILFSGFFKRVRSRLELVVIFLAVLEVVRQRLATLRQDVHFGEIVIVHRERSE